MTWRPNQTARLRITPTTAAVTAESAMVMRLLPRNCSMRSEEHTSELQSQSNLVCRLLLEKKKKQTALHTTIIKGRQASYAPNISYVVYMSHLAINKKYQVDDTNIQSLHQHVILWYTSYTL